VKKFIAAILGLLIFGGIILFLRKNNDKSLPVAPTISPILATPTTSSASSNYKDGIYTGDNIETERGYGSVQVKITISNGKLTDIQFLQSPNHPGHTQEVSSIALPILKQEALTAQSAQVDSVSGATQTSDAFQQSLQSALQKA